MTPRHLTLVLVLAACSAGFVLAAPPAPATAPAGGAAKVEVVGLSVAKADPNDKYGQSSAVGLQVGTHVHICIKAPGKSLIALAQSACSLEAFTDDKGTVLAKPAKSRQFGESWLWGFPHFSDDRQSCTVHIQGKAIPAAGATAVKIKTQIAVLYGSQEKSAEQKNADLKAGTKITAGPIPMEIESVESRSGDEPRTEVNLKGSAAEPDLAKIKTVTFHGADGKEIPTRSTGRMTSGDDKVSFQYGYELTGAPKQATIKITWFDKVETLSVPIDLSVGIGL